MDPKTSQTTEKILCAVLVVGACVVLAPFLPWLLLAAWVAHLTRGLHRKAQRLVRGSERGAAIIVSAVTLVVLVPLVLVGVSLSRDAIELGRRLMESKGARAALANLVSDGGPGGEAEFGPSQIATLLRAHGDRAWHLFSAVMGAATSAMIGFFLFLYGTYTGLVSGPRAFAWFRRVLPFRSDVVTRLADAFNETGRALFVGVGVTGLLQAVAATVTYLVLGIPRALVLGLLTFVASIVPSFGTALVWVPIAAGLALTGRPGAAVALSLVGVFVIGTVDNLLRPLIAHRADEHLPTFAVMVGMFGGLAVFGGWGVLLGPLLLRLAMEALLLARDVAPAHGPPRPT